MNAHPVRHALRRGPALIQSLERRVLFVRVEGIDVSQFQGVIDWEQVAASGKEFVFMRSSRTNLAKDPTFDANRDGATAAGLLVGVYHYTLPNNTGDAGPLVDPVLDARKFFAAGSSAMTTGFLRPVIDAEAAGPALGRAAYSQWINNFSDELERLSGVKPIVYANVDYAVNFLDESVAAEHDLWLARYNGGNDPSTVDPQTTQPEVANFHPNPYGSWNDPVGGPRSDDSWDFWQYTSNGPGIATGVSSTDLDLDLFNGDLETLKRNFQIGYQKNFATPGNNPFAVGPGITTRIEAENYDVGGQDVSYSDTTADLNAGGVYRVGKRDGVDLAAIDPAAGDNFRVTQTAPGEYVEYTIDVAAAGDYTLRYHVSQTEPGATIHAEVDGQALPALPVPDTNDFNSFAPLSQSATLAAGQHVVRVSFDGTGANNVVADLDRVEIAESPGPIPTPTPTPVPVPDGIVGPSAYARGGLFAAQNFGQARDLLVQRGRGSADTALTYLHFDLTDVASIPASAKLRLTGRLSDAGAPSLTTSVYSAGKTKTPFREDQVTFKKKPGAKKLRGSIMVSGTTEAAYEADLTAFLRTELAAGRKTVTLVLRNVTRSDTTQTVFGSDESATPPVLVIT